jgi:hypothetical protein
MVGVEGWQMKIALVPNWRSLWKAWSLRFAALGLVLPELLQLIADNTDTLDWLDAGWKTAIRIACLAGVILMRPVRQVSVSPEPSKDQP